MTGVFELAIVAGGALLIWGLMSNKNKGLVNALKREEEVKKKLKLEDISVIWTKKKKARIKLEELARLWRNFEISKEQADTPHFFTPVIKEFYEKHLQNKPYYTGKARVVINNLLTLLDIDGGVASVVSGQYESESKLPENTYQMLSMVTLAEHTIHVAEEIIRLVPYGPNLPVALIAALAHDIGKIPKYRKQYYSLGDHAFISMTVLESIQGFKDLVYADEILQAVRDHHLKPKTFIGEKLKEADTRARRRELVEVQKKLALTPSLELLERAEPNIDLSGLNEEPQQEVIEAGKKETLEEVKADEKVKEDEKKETLEVKEKIVEGDELTREEKKSKKKKKKSEVQLITLGEVDEALLSKEEDEVVSSIFGVPKGGYVSEVKFEEEKKDLSQVLDFKDLEQGADQTLVQGLDVKEPRQTTLKREVSESEDDQTFVGRGSDQTLSRGSGLDKWKEKSKEIPKELEVSNFFVNVPSEVLTEEKKEEQEKRPVEVPLTWFNPDEFLQRLLPYVNKLDEKGRWRAISMPNGVVYVQPRLIWDILVEMAKEKNIVEVFYYGESQEMKRNCLYSVLKQLQRHKDAVETSLIKDGYFSAPFYVKLRDGNVLSRVLYVPLKACEAFGVSVGELEGRKTGRLLEIEDIVPPYEEVKENENSFEVF
jgi:hypothetical protein